MIKHIHGPWLGGLLGLCLICNGDMLRSEEPAARAEAPPQPRATLSTAAAERLFRQRVWNLLNEKCLACHGEDAAMRKGELELHARAGMLRGGESGEPALVPGDPDASPLYTAVVGEAEASMPPKVNDRLTAEEAGWLRDWIAAGAPWPDLTAAVDPASDDDPASADDPATAGDPWSSEDGVAMRTSGGRSPAWDQRLYEAADLWAYRPVQRVTPPAAAIDAARVRNPIDAFIQQKLFAQGIQQWSPPADRRTLIRRLAFDLTGLPPDPADVAEFVADRDPQAYDKLVRRMLSSPRYAEQQARHWLDVVRYADTNGFSNDFERPNAWRYRDYVIRSFAADKPFDRFIVEQVAGDELDPDNPEMPIAVGFLRMGPWEHTAMTVAAVTRQQFLDDVTHHVGVSLLGQGLRCAACHDHKFDPVPTRDYYRIQACFAGTQFAEAKLDFLPTENTTGFADARAAVEVRLAAASAIVARLDAKSKKAVQEYLRAKGVQRVADLPEGERMRPDDFGLSSDELTIRKVYTKQKAYYQRELVRFEPYAFTVYNGPPAGYTSVKAINPIPAERDGAIPVVHILPGGAIDTPADPVTPGVLSAVAGSLDRQSPSAWNTIPTDLYGRRLALAKWIASPHNTLTARVIVNRIWQQHFGRGIVATPNNFGKMGAKPTHPELLDWLATWFVEHDWSIQALHRLIVTSETYRLAGDHPDRERLRTVDAKQTLYAYYPPRRLAAEEIRDALLAATGELSETAGGPGTFPEINWEVAYQPRHIMGAVAPAYQPSRTPQERNRRTIYAFRYRTLSDPLLEVFNRPGSEISCELRDDTTVTPQVFALFNSEFVAQRAIACALMLTAAAETPRDQLAIAYQRLYGRAPTEAEGALCLAHYEKLLAHHRRHAPPARPLPRSIDRHMVEELTGQTVHWTEALPGMEGYLRDTQPGDVSPDVRAMAEVCLVLFNSNEFLYVR